MNISDFLLVGLTWVDLLFICSVRRYIRVLLVGHVYLACIKRSYERYRFSQSSLLFSIAMLFLLLVYYLVQGAFIDASPIPSIDGRSSHANHCTDLAHCRTIWNIVWSCLATIFSCTWVAVHPNIPCPKKRNPIISFAEHRLPLFICALLVPEYVLAWAIRQFLKSQAMAKQNKGEFKILS